MTLLRSARLSSAGSFLAASTARVIAVQPVVVAATVPTTISSLGIKRSIAAVTAKPIPAYVPLKDYSSFIVAKTSNPPVMSFGVSVPTKVLPEIQERQKMAPIDTIKAMIKEVPRIEYPIKFKDVEIYREVPRIVIPPFIPIWTRIMPNNALRLEPGTVSHRQRDDTFKVTSRKFEPYENLTGISHERPEIVMLTNFLPLFVKDVGHSQQSFSRQVQNSGIQPFMTDAGRYVDTYMQARQLRLTNAVNLLRGVKTYNQRITPLLKKRQREFEQNVESLKSTSNFLLELVRSQDRLKAQLDLRDDIHTVDPHQVLRDYHGMMANVDSFTSSNVLFDYVKRYLPSTYSISDALVKLGYTSDNVRRMYSSTKVWMQLLLEMRNILNYHSAGFIGSDPITQRSDTNAVSISQPTTKLFGLRQTLPSLPSMVELLSLDANQIRPAIAALNQTWQLLYQDINFKTSEMQIAALANLVCKEYRYSRGLANQNVRRALADQFNYVVTNNDNIDVFDAIVGKFGTNITDFPAQRTNSLANIAQYQPATNVAVLSFESKYIDGTTGTQTPGSAYFVDQVLNTDGKGFDTSRLEEAAGVFEKASTSFGTIVNGMNLLAANSTSPRDRTYSSFSSILSSPVDFVKAVSKNLIDANNGNTLKSIISDNLASVFTFAAKNNNVKSALFMYTMSRTSSPYYTVMTVVDQLGRIGDKARDSASLTDYLIKYVVSTLQEQVPQAHPGTKAITGQTTSMTNEQIASALRSGTTLTRMVESIMKQVLSAFQANNAALVEKRTRFSGYLDTAIMMVAFDAVIQMIAKYNNQAIVSANYGSTHYYTGNLTYKITRTSTNFRSSINDLTTRIEKEVALTHQLVYTTLNTLQKLTSAFKNYANYLKSPPAVAKLREVTAIINDPTMLHMLMSEQQVMLLASTVQDLVEKVRQPGVVPVGGDVDGDGDFDAEDNLRVLDDSAMGPTLRNAFYGLFGTDEYASARGYNKKILTVGIPLGFSKRLKQRVSTTNMKKSTFVDKQNDIVSIVVYKVDLENSDIIYKPKKFLFEMSRFPVRNDKKFLTLKDKPSLTDIINSIPTRDFGTDSAFNDEPSFWPLGMNGLPIAFQTQSYEFLTAGEKDQIIQNHVVSYLLEVYIKMLTSISVADYHFDLVDPPVEDDDGFVKLITEQHITRVVDAVQQQRTSRPETARPMGGVLFTTTSRKAVSYVEQAGQARAALSNAAGVRGMISFADQFSNIQQKNVNTFGGLDTNGDGLIDDARFNLVTSLEKISHRNMPVLMKGIATINAITNTPTTLSGPVAMSKKIISPKQFDRIFNVTVDPDEFEIDYDKTMSTEHGKLAFEQMVKRGDIVPETENYFFRNTIRGPELVSGINNNPRGRAFVQGRAAQNVALYRFRDRNKSQGDLSFEKYFVTVETYGEDEV